VAETTADNLGRPLPHRVPVLGAAGGLGQGILRVCKAEGIKFERPAASADWDGAVNSWAPVSYEAMGRWMLGKVSAN
jgi:hypothetical protein